MKEPTLVTAIAELVDAPRVNIKGKQYAQVSTRLELFRKHFGFDFGVITEFIQVSDPDLVTVRAQVVDRAGIVVASGLAQEDRRQGRINATSAMENAETSAIGRALACFGLIGGEYASANEMEKATAHEEDRRRPQENSVASEDRYAGMQPREREFRQAVDEAFPRSPSVSRFDFYNPANNAPEEIDKVFMEIDRISNLPELQAYFSSLAEWLQWLKPNDLAEIKQSFKSRNNQLKGQ